MDMKNNTEEIPYALITAGLREIEAHGIQGFSVRRIASDCGISCATPYRYFKDKDGCILAIISYVTRQWNLLARQVEQAYAQDERKMITELCIAAIRFWTANTNFRSILFLRAGSSDSAMKNALSDIYSGIDAFADKYFAFHGINDIEERKLRCFLLRAIISEAIMTNSEVADNTTHAEIQTALTCIERTLEI